jgi:hypothetical protein
MKKLIAGMVLLGLILLPVSAKAHVLIADTGRQTGAVLHVTPDDDPIAGKPSDLFFELDASKISSTTHALTLSAANSTGAQTSIPAHARGNTVSAAYTFPSQGVYTISLAAEPLQPGEQRYEFSHTQRISRGTALAAQPKAPQHDWAYAAVVASTSVMVVLGIVAYNKGNDIIAYSKF